MSCSLIVASAGCLLNRWYVATRELNFSVMTTRYQKEMAAYKAKKAAEASEASEEEEGSDEESD